MLAKKAPVNKPSRKNMLERIYKESRVSKKVGPMVNSETETRILICTAKDWCLYERNIFFTMNLLSLPDFQRLSV